MTVLLPFDFAVSTSIVDARNQKLKRKLWRGPEQLFVPDTVVMPDRRYRFCFSGHLLVLVNCIPFTIFGILFIPYFETVSPTMERAMTLRVRIHSNNM